MEILISRLWSAPETSEHRATITGVLSIDSVQNCFTLEPEALLIPAGTYPIKMLWSERFQRKTPHICDVPDRSEIELHGGNKATDSEGCILCAEKRINGYEIYESKPATDAIEEALEQAEADNETNTITIEPLARPVEAQIGG